MALEELFLIGISVLVLPPVLRRLHINIRAGEVITGVFLAFLMPELVGSEWLNQFAQIGLIVLMFEIGLDIDVEHLKTSLKASMAYGSFSFFFPFIAAFGTATVIFQDIRIAFILAAGIASSSLAVVAPILREKEIESDILENVTMISEMLGVTALVAFVKNQSSTGIPVELQAALIIGFVSFMVFLLPKIVEKLNVLHQKEFIEVETKFILFLVVSMALVSEQLGIHAATGAFLTGMFFSESTHKGFELEERLKPIIEIFTPIFFLHIGAMISPESLTTMAVVSGALIASVVYFVRIFSFRIASVFTEKDLPLGHVSLLAPSITISATAAEIGRNSGLLQGEVFTSLITAGVLLTVAGPAVFNLSQRLR